MAVGTTAALLIAGGAFSATAAIGAGNAQAKGIAKQAEYNAQVYEQQAGMIMSQKKLKETQFNRQAAAMRGAIVSKTAGKGFMLGGSPLAILADTESQMQFDSAIEDYNLDVEANFAKSGAAYSRGTGAAQSRLARFSGYTNSFSTALNTGTNAYLIGKL
jgi:hypothetical protein